VTSVPSLFNFNGGTLRASASRSDFLQGLTATTVYPGGATFDTAGNDVAVYQPLRAPTGYGASYIPLRSNGAGYVGAPAVVITGGSGTGATAIATVDVTDGPNKGTVTGISVTSPGFGYQPSDKLSVALFGGGTVSPAITNDCAFSLNSNLGGLTKLGLGTLTLAATNTYGGATVVSNGVLALAVREALPTGSVVRVDGGVLNMGGYAITNRSLTVTSGSVLNGKLVCDSVVKTGSGKMTLGTSLSSATPIVIAEGTLKLQSGQPGLYEGTLYGAFNTTESFSACSNVTVQLGTRMANTSAIPPWGLFATYVYSGYIWNRTGADATWTFGESIDDSVQLKIDSTVVINGGSSWDIPTIGTYKLTPGAHAFEARFGNGPGGAGLVPNKIWWMTNTFGFGIDYQGHTVTNYSNFITNFFACTDLGDGSLLSCTAASSGSTNLIDAATGMTLGSNTLVDLDGYVQTLSSLSGFGMVSNGMLSIAGTLAPGGTNVVGEMTIARNTTLNSGTLSVDIEGAVSDKLIVQGTVNLSNMILEIANPAALDRSKVYTVLSCTGTRNGKFTFNNAGLDSRWHPIYRSDGSVQLLFVDGTLIKVR
jgi:autotransporter-associated beta strand protein